MPLFKYTAKDATGKTVVGKLIADSRDVVIEELRKRKLVIIDVAEIKQKASMFKIGGGKVTSDELVVFSRQLATMVDAGIPLIQSLDALQDQMKSGEFKRVLSSLRDDIETGSSLSASFAKYPHAFDHLYINMVKAGESSGMLNVVLERLADYLEKTMSLKRKIRSAMIYPSIVISFAVIITGVLMIKVVPTFESIFDMLQGQLPIPTQILIAISNLFRKWFLYMVGVVILVSVGASRYYRTENGKLRIDALKLRVPVMGPLFSKVAISRFSRTLATLIQSGVPILGSLEIVATTTGNKVIENAVDKVRANVREGESIAAPLIRSGVFPAMVTRMISVGEQTGELEKMLAKISDFYDEQVDVAVAGLASMIEPMIIAFLGVVVGGIVIALFLPIFQITRLIGG
ncbi:type II secretion system F family protein [Candidatus Omnitrophota bacterium]